MSGDWIGDLTGVSGGWAAVSFAFMLILARTAAATILLPGIGESAAPSIVRAGFALSVSILVLPSLTSKFPAPSEVGLDAATALISEVTTGLLFGWLARVWVQSLAVSAQFMAYFLGLSSVLQPDPELGPQTAALAHLFDRAAPVIILASGLFTLPIRALIGSYTLIPAGKFLSASVMAEASLSTVVGAFELALQLASPFLVASVVWHVSLGLLARLVPKLQIYIVSLPGQVLGGLFLLSLTISVILGGWFRGIQAGLAPALSW